MLTSYKWAYQARLTALLVTTFCDISQACQGRPTKHDYNRQLGAVLMACDAELASANRDLADSGMCQSMALISWEASVECLIQLVSLHHVHVLGLANFCPCLLVSFPAAFAS